MLPEYTVEQDSIAAGADLESKEMWALARQYDQRGDRYVLLTVIFASVLFFGGISEKFEDNQVRVWILVMGTLLFTGAFGLMLSYPVWL